MDIILTLKECLVFPSLASIVRIICSVEAREGKTRHSFQGIGHTTYLCFARKAFFGRGTKKLSEKTKTLKTKPVKTTKTPKATKTPKTTKTSNTVKKSSKK